MLRRRSPGGGFGPIAFSFERQCERKLPLGFCKRERERPIVFGVCRKRKRIRAFRKRRVCKRVWAICECKRPFAFCGICKHKRGVTRSSIGKRLPQNARPSLPAMSIGGLPIRVFSTVSSSRTVRIREKGIIMKKNLTELVFIVDRSGSMGGMESDTIGGINSVLSKNRAAEGECTVSIVLFDDTMDTLVDRKPIAEVANLTERDYQVRGCTALLDCLGKTIRHIDCVQGYMPDEYKAEKVIFVVTTDGLENASTQYSYADVKRAVEQHNEKGWEFVFLGANMDAISEAGRLGISADRAATYIADKRGSQVMYGGVGRLTEMLRSNPCASVGASWKEAIEEDTAGRS